MFPVSNISNILKGACTKMKKTIRENAAIILATMCVTAAAISVLFPLYAAAGSILTFISAIGIAALCVRQFADDKKSVSNEADPS